jgi:RNA polymerase sigma-70 factor (ECF subfamily)
MGNEMVMQTSTEALVSAAQRGDRTAFDALAERYRRRLERQIRSRLSRSSREKLTDEDVLQETLLRAFASIARFRWRSDESFYRWLASIAEYRIRNAARKTTWRQLQIEHEAPGTSPSRSMRREERFARLQASLDDLDEDQRQAIYLARVEGLPLRQIAARLGRSEEAIRKLVARGLLKLRGSIGDTESLGLPDRPLRLNEEASDETR